MTKCLRVAIIGAGNHSERNHGPSLRDLHAARPEEIELAAVCDLDQAKARAYAERFGFTTTYTDFRDMVRRERLDAVVAVTPVPVTRAVVGELLPFRIPILMEKPPGVDSGEARELLADARSAGTPVMVSLNRRFGPALTRARDWIRKERGEPRRIRAVAGRMLRVARVEKAFITSTGIHLTDAVLSLLAPIARADSRRWSSDRGGQSCLATVRDTEGVTASLLMAPDAGSDEETYEIVGDQFHATVDTWHCALRIYEGGRLVLQWAAAEGTPEHVANGALAETQAFLEGVRSGAMPPPSLDDALRSVLTCEALELGGSTTLR